VTVSERDYTTGQVAEFFGVSIPTVHNWIEIGRLTGIEKLRSFDPVRIPNTAIWMSSAREKLSLDEVIAMNEKEQKTRPPYPATKADERRAIECETSHFTERYGGSFQDTLYRKMKQNIPLVGAGRARCR